MTLTSARVKYPEDKKNAGARTDLTEGELVGCVNAYTENQLLQIYRVSNNLSELACTEWVNVCYIESISNM